MGVARVVWYRVVLPAMFLECDWAGLAGSPPELQFVTGFVGGMTQPPDLMSYDIVVLQQPRGPGWMKMIREMRDKGITVLYEVDDYVHGIRQLPQHDFAPWFRKDHLKQMEMCMRACDGMIVSTEYLKEKYARFGRGRAWVCENGLDLARYRYTLPPRSTIDGVETVTILWAGATGHVDAVRPWAQEIQGLMRKHPNLCFVSIGQGFGGWLHEEFGVRAVSLPFSGLDTYPAAMMAGDIVVAPLGEHKWHQAKSDLRAMEAAALGLPIVADKHYKDSVVDGETGFVVSNTIGVRNRLERLICDREMRLKMGAVARQHATAKFDMRVRQVAWREALSEAWTLRQERVAQLVAA